MPLMERTQARSTLADWLVRAAHRCLPEGDTFQRKS